jgi:flavin reductase (DIM6/NTAB) family NADH-FMN oxidoreductase RutF
MSVELKLRQVAEPFDVIMRSLDPRMAVVTTADRRERAGCLVGFHVQSSIDPPRYTIWLSKANHTYRVGLRATHFGIHFLTADDLDVAELFGTRTGDRLDKFRDLPVGTGAGGVPVLLRCPHRLIVRKVAQLDDGSDHVCVTTEPVEEHTTGRFAPLRLSDVDHLKPGHGADEEPPVE